MASVTQVVATPVSVVRSPVMVMDHSVLLVMPLVLQVVMPTVHMQVGLTVMPQHLAAMLFTSLVL
jgi:hypothetical protein